ncbi:MAG TPA: Hint domain-containing protein [Anaerolineales bacterium]
MRLRPLPLVLAPLWLLAALSLLVSCTNATGSATAEPGGGGGVGVATASVITVVPAGTSIIGGVPNATLPPFPTPEPPTPIPPLPSASLSPTELKYRVLDQFPDFFFCDPDYYPVARADEGQLADQRFSELQADQEEFRAILAHLGLSGVSNFSENQKLQIYREHKRLAALHFVLAGDQYQFQFLTGGQGKQGVAIQGTIDGSGHVNIQQRTPAFATCPICLAVHTRIDTPNGPVLVEDVKPGDPVWTLNGSGARIVVPVLRVARVPVSAGHLLIHLALDDGRELWASPGHPTADGRVLAELQPGAMLDGARVVLAESFAYDGSATYDLLPAGPTGTYWADGILMGSTLHP